MTRGKQNNNFRTALWTGRHLQLTLMSIKVGEDIGLEVHPNLDQFIRIEEGQGLVIMGDSKCNLNFQRYVYDDFAFIIPAGKWHINVPLTGHRIEFYGILHIILLIDAWRQADQIPSILSFVVYKGYPARCYLVLLLKGKRSILF